VRCAIVHAHTVASGHYHHFSAVAAFKLFKIVQVQRRRRLSNTHRTRHCQLNTTHEQRCTSFTDTSESPQQSKRTGNARSPEMSVRRASSIATTTSYHEPSSESSDANDCLCQLQAERRVTRSQCR
jgi:hypothetical protein